MQRGNKIKKTQNTKKGKYKNTREVDVKRQQNTKKDNTKTQVM